MDHGVWPLFTLNLYINQTGDLSILDEEVSYWKDAQIERAKRIDLNWNKKKEIVKRQKMVNVIAAQSWNILFWKM